MRTYVHFRSCLLAALVPLATAASAQGLGGPQTGRVSSPAVVLRAGAARCRVPCGASDLAAFVKAVNATAHLDGLPDALNPQVLDLDKLVAFVAALPRLPAPTRRRLAGRELYLGASGLGVGTAEPTHSTAFQRPFDLFIAPNSAPAVVARASVAADPALAQQRAAAARAAVVAAGALATQLNRARTGPMTAAEGAALARQDAAARAWLLNAQAWAAAPASPAARASLAAAKKAVQAFGRPSGAL